MGSKDPNRRTRIDDLRTLPLFADATDAELDRIDALMASIEVEAGARLTTEGAGGLDVVLVVEGRASVTRGGEEIAVVGPGDLVGEMSVLSRAPRNATVTALTPMRVSVMHLGEFDELLRIAPSVREKVERIAAERGGRLPASRRIAGRHVLRTEGGVR